MKTITKCRSCDGTVTEFLDLGTQYTSDFREDDSKTPAFPLVAVLCDSCFLVQLRDTTPSEVMYHENYGFKSGVSNSIKEDLRDVVASTLARTWMDKPSTWLDIASNDGTLLSYVPKSIYRVGCDPITKYCKLAVEHADEIVNEFFSAKPFEQQGKDAVPQGSYDQFDIITSISCFYDMDDPNLFVADVAKVLASDGLWTIQQNYLLPTMELNAVDNFCHEHLEYYTLLSLEPLLERHGLEVVDLSTSMVNGGSLRTFVAHKGAYPTQDSVEKQRAIEQDAKLNTKEPYERFAHDVWKNIRELRMYVKDQLKDGKRVAILAASTRGATIWQAADLGPLQICYAVERNPEKVGKYFNAIGVPIVSEEYARKDKPDVMIIGPWFFASEIIDREKDYIDAGGVLVNPLPTLEIIRK